MFHGGGPGSGPPRGPNIGGPSARQLYAADVPAVEDERLATHDQLLQGFAEVESGPELPLPPPSGTMGEHITLRTNLLPTNFDVKIYYDYELKFQPTKGLAAERKDHVLGLVEEIGRAHV